MLFMLAMALKFLAAFMLFILAVALNALGALRLRATGFAVAGEAEIPEWLATTAFLVALRFVIRDFFWIAMVLSLLEIFDFGNFDRLSDLIFQVQAGGQTLAPRFPGKSGVFLG
jgi:hypothetical protein